MRLQEKCANHPDCDAVSICRNCGQPFCGDCLIEGKEYYYCAQESCQAEMKARNDELIAPDQSQEAPARLVTIARYSWPYEADLAKAHLQAAGIMAFVTDEFLVNLNWLYSNAVGGVRLQVPEEDADAARELLKQDLSSEAEQASEDL